MYNKFQKDQQIKKALHTDMLVRRGGASPLSKPNMTMEQLEAQNPEENARVQKLQRT